MLQKILKAPILWNHFCEKGYFGRAQLGLNYGITNTLGMLSEAAAAQLLKHAYIAGIDTIDTAPGYGESQQRLGKCAAGDFHYISKVSVNGLSDAEDIKNEIKISLHKTLQDLQVSNLSALLVHDVTPMLTSTSIKNMVIETLQELKVSGLISAAGVSLYNSAQSKELCRDWFPDVIQLPVSILNQDMVVSGELRRLHAAGTEIHARSIFMQGLSC
ncbi:MAG: aldo/keto reductase [Alphaproteobacteria bacterium]|nr:aldo/keto reductase [Alphaproteobacteria bacterium]